MKLILLTAVVATCTACAPAPQRPYSPYTAQCEYEATAATANINNVFTQAIERQRLIDMCLNAKAAQG